MDFDRLHERLARCRLGDRQAFEDLYEMAGPQLFALVLRIVKRRDWAEEVLQESFIQIWHRAGDYHAGRGSAWAWMSGIARFRAIDCLRRQRESVALDDIEEPVDLLRGPLQEAVRGDGAAHLAECLDELSKDQRRTIVLAFIEGLTHGEVARHLQTPIGTVKSWVRRGLAALRRCMQP
ncbi:sigma-70 family RNA polymerase sigma factor [Thioalkalivibrio sp. ALJT]|uniref:sigma-70 family RNA polymerase sigma factor n=1 Tax=Thioalkalivibrio sp. ALJT TaxID=1158146 RepID=UPI0003810C75|nr:sigma-70 family RNA polymerase sigma factor [Thioalkalivibrio sp. ALJT]